MGETPLKRKKESRQKPNKGQLSLSEEEADESEDCGTRKSRRTPKTPARYVFDSTLLSHSFSLSSSSSSSSSPRLSTPSTSTHRKGGPKKETDLASPSDQDSNLTLRRSSRSKQSNGDNVKDQIVTKESESTSRLRRIDLKFRIPVNQDQGAARISVRSSPRLIPSKNRAATNNAGGVFSEEDDDDEEEDENYDEKDSLKNSPLKRRSIVASPKRKPQEKRMEEIETDESGISDDSKDRYREESKKPKGSTQIVLSDRNGTRSSPRISGNKRNETLMPMSPQSPSSKRVRH